MSTMTDVSSNPWPRRSDTIRKVLVDHIVDVLPEGRGVHAGCTTKHLYGRMSGHETMASKRTQFTDRGAVAIDDECLTLMESLMIRPLSLRSSRWEICPAIDLV